MSRYFTLPITEDTLIDIMVLAMGVFVFFVSGVMLTSGNPFGAILGIVTAGFGVAWLNMHFNFIRLKLKQKDQQV